LLRLVGNLQADFPQRARLYFFSSGVRKRLVADLSLDKAMLQDVLAKKL
jgi:hypothetical protein